MTGNVRMVPLKDLTLWAGNGSFCLLDKNRTPPKHVTDLKNTSNDPTSMSVTWF